MSVVIEKTDWLKHRLIDTGLVSTYHITHNDDNNTISSVYSTVIMTVAIAGDHLVHGECRLYYY